jgi:hypothetical protein
MSTQETKVEPIAQTITNKNWAKQKGLKHPERLIKRPRYGKELKGLVGQVNVTCAVSKSLLSMLEEQCLQDGVSRSDILRAALIREVAFRKFCRENGATPLAASHLGTNAVKAVAKVKPAKQKLTTISEETLDQIQSIFKALNG